MLQTGNTRLPAWLPTTLALLLSSALLFSTYHLAESVARFGFSDPDTCWLLAVGRCIVEQGVLPASDPFSYTRGFAGGAGEPQYVIYQWLSEVFFYLGFKSAGLIGPLVMVALVLVNTFIVIPLAVAKKLHCPQVLSIGLAVLSAWSIFPRFFVRPEIWSNLFIVLWLVLLGALRLRSLRHAGKGEGKHEAIEWRPITVALVLVILWCNFHCCFVVAFLLLIAHIGSAAVESIATGSFKKSFSLTDWLILPFGIMASLINPWGIGLWTYLPKIFFAPVNHMIKELQPFALKDLQHPYYYPFLALSLLCCFLMAVRIRWAAKHKKLQECIGLFAPLLMAGAVLEAIVCKRAVAFTVAITVMCLLAVWREVQMPAETLPSQPLSKKQKKKKRKRNQADLEAREASAAFAAELEKRLDNIFGSKYLIWLGAINVFTALTVIAYCRIYPQTLPQARSDFRPPIRALQYLSANKPAGNIFNSTLFGDAMIWYLKGNPRVFIDTRFDLYSAELSSDYADIFFCHSGWQALMKKYCIDWVFVPPESILACRLAEDSSWHKLYADEDAVILSHKRDH